MSVMNMEIDVKAHSHTQHAHLLHAQNILRDVPRLRKVHPADFTITAFTHTVCSKIMRICASLQYHTHVLLRSI